MVQAKTASKAQDTHTTALATTSERFVAEVQRQFTAQMGSQLAWTDYQRTLAQHLFLKIDATLKALDAKRQDNQASYTWENVNLQKLALDAVHRVSLGLDALIPNHIHPIPYWNSALKKYDIDLRIGYVGKLFCRTELAVEKPLDVIIHLVHETDRFVPLFRGANREIESYEFEVTQPFNRGPVVGGFGYIMYEDPRKNRLVLVTMEDFDKARRAAKSTEFWGDEKDEKWRKEMMYKTVVHRVADKIPLDPRKVNAPSYAYIEAQEAEAEEREMAAKANGVVIDVEPEYADEAPPADEPAATQPAPQREPTATAQATLLDGPGF